VIPADTFLRRIGNTGGSSRSFGAEQRDSPLVFADLDITPTNHNAPDRCAETIYERVKVVFYEIASPMAPMKQIGICGTFDVENYGDLLFPMLAEKELTCRLGPLKLHRFSYYPKFSPDWPYDVTSVVELPKVISKLDAMIIGGGHLIRFDKDIARDYVSPHPGIHHPTGYWLTPALIALQNNVPLLWNAPGVCGEIPAWAEPLLKSAVDLSRYVSVRDEQSWKALARISDHAEIAIVPDSAFGIGQLINPLDASPDFVNLRASLGLTGPYIVIQATKGLDAFANCAQCHPELFAGYQQVLVPIGPSLGDDVALLAHLFPQALCVRTFLHPHTMAELIAGAAAVVGMSLHLSITALAYGVPVFRPAHRFMAKYSILSAFDDVYAFDDCCEIDPEWFISRFGKTKPALAVSKSIDRLALHWDRVAEAIQTKRMQTVPRAFGSFLETVPILLEDWACRYGAEMLQVAELREKCSELSTNCSLENKRALENQLAEARMEIAKRDGAREEQAVSFNNQLAQVRREIAERETLVAASEARIAEADSAHASALAEQAVLFDNQLAQARREIAERDDLVAASEVKIAEANSAHASALAQQTVLFDNQLAQARIEIARLESGLAEIVSTHASSLEQIRSFNDQLTRALAEIDKHDGEILRYQSSRSWRVTAPLRTTAQKFRQWKAELVGVNGNGDSTITRLKARVFGKRSVIRTSLISGHSLAAEPYGWAVVDNLFSAGNSKALADTFPRDHFKKITGYDDEKGYEYEARALIGLGATDISNAGNLSPEWRQLAADLLSPAYRAALARLTGIELTSAGMEVNVCHYGPGAWLGPHIDLKEKVVTHVLYFNRTWNEANGGCLNILCAPDMTKVACTVLPVVGNSAVIVRSDRSWHAVSHVAPDCLQSRRSVTVTFYHPGALSTMWPAGDESTLRDYDF